MKFYAINGSPRKDRNTATLLQAALDGARSAAGGTGVGTELVHLYDLEYKSCLSCFQCKRLGGKSYGRCAVKDPLAPLLERLADADGIIFGSPIYFGTVTGKMHSFLERLLFPYVVYDKDFSSLAPKRMPTAFLYTMNVTAEMMAAMEYEKSLKFKEMFVERVFSKPQVMYAWNTYQFDDYSKYMAERFSEPDKAAYRRDHFPADCETAFRIGSVMAGRPAADASQG